MHHESSTQYICIMGEPATLTMRIDPSLKAAAETAAKAQGISLTELVQRSMRAYTTPVCPACGRASAPQMVSPGFSEGFNSFMDEWATDCSTGHLTLLTQESSEVVAYLVTLDLGSRMNKNANSGVVNVHVWLGGKQSHRVGIPRGWIIGWCGDLRGEHFANYCSLGYIDGNARVQSRVSRVSPIPPRKGAR